MSAFDTSAFLKFLFSIIFMFFCSFTLLHWVPTVSGFLITLICRYFFLKKHTRFHIRSFHLAPLQARIFFQGVLFQNENFSLRIGDGYITFAFWAFWFKNPNWTRVHEYMVSESLIRTRCRVNVNLKSIKGVIVGVDEHKKKIHVQLEPSNTGKGNGGSDDESDEEEEMQEQDSQQSDFSSEDLMNRPFDTNLQQEAKEAFSTGHKREKVDDPGTCKVPIRKYKSNDPSPEMNRPGDEVVRTFDASDVKIRSKPGRIQIHLNGMRFCVYNATGKYQDLAKPMSTSDGNGSSNAANAAKTKEKSNLTPKTTIKERLVKIFKKKLIKRESNLDGENGNTLPAEEDQRIVEARKCQQHRLKTKSFMQKMFNFIDSVELELFTTIIDIGGAGSSHPYFLHMSFQRAEGRVFLTRDGCPSLDLYRTVVELSLDNLDLRMAQMDSKLTETQFRRNASLRDRAQLLFRGKENNLGHDFDNPQSSDLIRDFGVLVDGKHRSKAHIVFYKDTPNVYAGEEVVRGKLPTTGFELLVDTPELCYGPWLEYCRFQLWQFFLPPNYRPLERLNFEIGAPRPNASFEFFVEFIRETTIMVPFKRRTPVPSPPFGIKDSHERGYLMATIGAGSQYIQPGFYLLPGETRQNFQSLFISNNIKVRTNCVLGKDSLFAEVDSLEFFLDRQDDILWNGRKLWNILPKLYGAQVFFYFCYVDFFLDLLNDWQFTAQMYHNVPLTTELFNTFDRVVKFCIPNVKRFEVFVESKATLFINVNQNNVVFSDDPNDFQYNAFAKVSLRSAIFNMLLPADQYQLSYENEIVRPLRVSVQDIKAYLCLPPTHPLAREVSSEIPWAVADRCEVKGVFTVNVGNQARPQDRYNMNPSTGRTRLHNYFNLNIEFTNTKGTLMAPHILCLLHAFHNIFLDHMLTIHPDELFWLLEKLQSNAITGKNKRKEFKQFLECSQPAGNDLEICVNVKLVNTEANASVGKHSHRLNIKAGVFTFNYVKQFAVTDTCVSISPVTACIHDSNGRPTSGVNSFLTVGDISVGLIKHFARMPLKPKIHDSMDIKVNGVSFSFSLEELVILLNIGNKMVEHLKLDDATMEAQVDNARRVAELAAEEIAKRSTTKASATNRFRNRTAKILSDDDEVRNKNTNNKEDKMNPPLESIEIGGIVNNTIGERPKKKKKVFFLPLSSSDTETEFGTRVSNYTSFANEVSYEVALEFAKTMEAHNKAEDDSKDYGLFFTFVSILYVQGRVRIANEGWVSIDIPCGVSIAMSSLNDGNSNKRLSVAAKDVGVRAFVPFDKIKKDEYFSSEKFEENEKHAEIFHFQTSLCLRQYIAYPFDGSLENHMYKQQRFIKNNDYEDLMNFKFTDVKSPLVFRDHARESETGEASVGDTQSQSGRGRTSTFDSVRQRLQHIVSSSSDNEESSSEPSSSSTLSSSVFPRDFEHRGTKANANLQSSKKSKDSKEYVKNESKSAVVVESPGSETLKSEPSTQSPPNLSGHGSPQIFSPLDLQFEATATCRTGEQFETCISASDISDSQFLMDSFYDPLADEELAFEAKPSNAKAPPPEASPTLNKPEYIMHEEIPMHKFYRVYFSSLGEEDETLLQYSAHQSGNRRERGSSTGFHAPLPSSAFILVEYPEEFPEYSIARNFYDNYEEAGDDFFWKRGCADNRKRSMQGSTTKHLHVDVTEPITMLVSKEVSCLVASIICVVRRVAQNLSSNGDLLKSRTTPFDFEESVAQPSVTGSSFFKDTKKKNKSRARKQQKRWQWEDVLISAIVPCVELKLLTALPVPVYNLPSMADDKVIGMYSTTFGVRNINFVMGYNQPPAGVEGTSIISKKLNASLSLAMLSIVTQIEYEPIVREGKLLVDAPYILYDENKDTIGIFYIAKIRGRGKRDIVRGTVGGACSVLVDTIGIHITKDFVSYTMSVLSLITAVKESMMERVQTENWSEPSTSSVAVPNLARQASSSPQMRSGPRFPTSSRPSDKSRTVQGKGSIRLFRVVLINTIKQTRYIKLDILSSSVFEIQKPTANFVVVTPRSTREKNIQIQFIGDVDVFRVRLFPSLLYLFDESVVESRQEYALKRQFSDEFTTTSGNPLDSNSGPAGGSGADMRFNIVYNGTFSLHNLDVSVLHSEMNYIQLKGKNLTGCAESRAEKVSSRECVQMEVLTEAISERLKDKLRNKANQARERAKESRYASPASISSQLQLKSTASFFADQLLLHYVADIILPKDVNNINKQRKLRDSQVAVASIYQIALGAQFTEQYDIAGGDQINIQMVIQRVHCVTPFRPGESETIHPQLQQMIASWRKAAHTFKTKTDGLTNVAHSPKKSEKSKPKNRAFVLSVQAKNFEAVVELPMNVSQVFTLPQLAIFLQHSTDGRLGAKIHAYPFSIASKVDIVEDYRVTLPHIYFIYAHDDIKLTSSVMVETVAITITPLFINHLITTIDKFRDMMMVAGRQVPMDYGASTRSTDVFASMSTFAPTKPEKRRSFLFLLKGLRFSYLTSMTNLRFSIRSLNAKAETAVSTNYRVLDWIVNVTSVQVALVDRDDHDQIIAWERSKLLTGKEDHAGIRSRKNIFPLGGFIWGSAELSFTVSSGKRNYNTEVQDTLRQELRFQACSPELQKTLLDTVGHSTAMWELNVFSPLVILRIGLDSVIKQTVNESKSNIFELKKVAVEEGERLRLLLNKEKTFKRLQAQKRKYEALIKKNEEARAENARRVAEKVVKDASFRRRNAIGNDENDLLHLLRMTSEHKVSTSITNCVIVVPFGDAVFKNLLDANSDFFSCGKTAKHVHNANCLKRKKFIPSCALKAKLSEASFSCSIVNIQNFAPIILKDSADLVVKSFLTTERKISGRVLSNKLSFYFTSGSTFNASDCALRFIDDTVILGGVGFLSSDSNEEIRTSRNTILIETVEAPFHFQKIDKKLTICAVLDITGPMINTSTRLVNLFSEFVREFPTKEQCILKKTTDMDDEFSVNDSEKGLANGNVDSSYLKSDETTETSIANGEEERLLFVDLSARLGIGTLRMYSFGAGSENAQTTTKPSETRFSRKFNHNSRKKADRTAKVVTPEEEKGLEDSRSPKLPESAMSCILTIPLPAIMAQIYAKRSSHYDEKDECIIRCEVKAGTIEINPCIAALSREMEQNANDYDALKKEYERKVIQKIQEIESIVQGARYFLYTSVPDLLLPIPRAYATVLFNRKISQLTSTPKPSRKRRASEVMSVTGRKKKQNSLISVHVSLSEFSFVLSAEPLASTYFSVFLDSQGTVDLLLKFFNTPSTEAFLNSVPENIVIVNVRRLKAECQTKLEVKSVEISLPEAEVLLNERKGQMGKVKSLVINLPFNAEGSDPNLIVRVPHISQVFTVQQLWTSVLGESVLTIKRLFESDKLVDVANASIFKHDKKANRVRKECVDTRFFIVVCVSYGLCHFDLGSGNKHQLFFGKGRLAVEARECENGEIGVNLLRCYISNFTTRSEGVLAGVLSVGDIIAQGFTIENVKDGENFLRSPENRTFRMRALVKKVHVSFKERQLKDIFECKITFLDCNAMDGVGMDWYSTSDMDVVLSRATLGVTPSTVPAFLAFIKGVSFMVADQKRIANEKLKDERVQNTQFLFVAGQIKESLHKWERRKSSYIDNDATPRKQSTSFHPFDDKTGSEKNESSGTLTTVVEPLIPYLGNPLTHIPCGQLRFSLEDTMLLLGAISAGEAATGCVVANFPKTRLTFAECPTENYTVAKKMVIIETHNVELYRPGSYKVVIMGFRGDNYFEFFTKQALGSKEIQFTLLLKQTHPWTGNPRFRDFEEMISLIKSFADKKNANVFQTFGSVDANFNLGAAEEPKEETPKNEAPLQVHLDSLDERVLKAIKTVNFSPQLRFGGDVSVNTEVILNWLGITEKMLPNVLNSKLCDQLENALYKFSENTSEREKKKQDF